MKKILIFLILLILAISFYSWFNKEKIASFILSYHLKTTVSLKTATIKNGLTIQDLTVKNIKNSKNQPAIHIENTNIKAPLKDLLAKKITIDSVHMKDITLKVEYYNSSGSKNNWAEIMANADDGEKKGKPYLIKNLVLENLSLYVYKKDGTIQKFKNLKTIHLKNLSSESDFEHVENAIFHAVLQSVFKNFGLNFLLNTINPKTILQTPINVLKKVFPFLKQKAS